MKRIVAVLLLTASLTLGASVPAHLADFSEEYQANPRQAAIQWFQKAKFGLFIHYALASLLERGKPGLMELAGDDRVMGLIMEPVETLQKTARRNPSAAAALRIKQDLFNRFTASSFDAGAFCDLAEAAGMKYITLTTKHLGGLYLFRTRTTRFNSVRSPAKRDLVAELAEACRNRGLGLFLYVPPEFARTDADHWKNNQTVLRELLTQYGAIAGIWFDGIGDYYKEPGNYARLPETFAMVRSLQPHCLISFKEGAIGEEDFRSPEHFLLPTPYDWKNPKQQARWNIRLARWEEQNPPERWKLFRDMPAEINSVMQECSNRDGVGEAGGWINDEQARHLSADELWALLLYARAMNANLLMNIGPRGDGSIHPADEKALREVGRRIKESGFPEPK